MSSKVLQLVAVGSPPPGLLRDMEEPLRTYLSITPVVSKKDLTAPTYAFNKDRQQYHCNAIMRRLTAMIEPGQVAVLGMTDVDLFVPDAPFVFGDADRESKAGLVSLFRLRQLSAEAFKRCVQIEVVHQAGHLLGLSNCEDVRCVMFAAATPADLEKKNIALCNLCRNELAKLNR